jgi:hypothetical protein
VGEIIAGKLFQGLKARVGIESTQKGSEGSPADSMRLVLSDEYICSLDLQSPGVLEARVGIEPTHKGFADLSLTTWVPRPKNSGE